MVADDTDRTERFVAVLDQLSESLRAQLHITVNLDALHPSPPADFKVRTADARRQFEDSLMKFSVELRQAAGASGPPPLSSFALAASPTSDFANEQLPAQVESSQRKQKTPKFDVSEVASAPSFRHVLSNGGGDDAEKELQFGRVLTQNEDLHKPMISTPHSRRTSGPTGTKCFGAILTQEERLRSYDTQFLGANEGAEDGMDIGRHRCWVIGEKVENLWSPGAMNPRWYGKRTWDVLIIALVLCDAMILPFQLCFKDIDTHDAFDNVWFWLLQGFFSTDIALNFVTAYEEPTPTHPGALVIEWPKIARNYIGNWFTLDLVSTIPWSLLEKTTWAMLSDSHQVTSDRMQGVFASVRLLRVTRMIRIWKLNAAMARLEKRASFVQLQINHIFKALLAILVICHWNACVWWLVGQERSWIVKFLCADRQADFKKNLHWTTLARSHGPGLGVWTWMDRSLEDVYIFCFYWTLGVMRTMPAEVTPVNHYERMYVLVFMLVAFTVFALTVATVTQTVFKVQERRRSFNDEMTQVRTYLLSVKAPERLQRAVMQYFRHLFEARRIKAPENQLLDLLPLQLSRRVQGAFLSQHLKKLTMLCNMKDTDPDLLVFIHIVKLHDLVPGEVVARRNYQATCAWVLISGRLQQRLQTLNSASSVAMRTTQTYVPDFRHARAVADVGLEADLLSADDYDPEKLLEVVDEGCLRSQAAFISPHTVFASACSHVLRIESEDFYAIIEDSGSRLKHLLFNNRRPGGQTVRTKESGNSLNGMFSRLFGRSSNHLNDNGYTSVLVEEDTVSLSRVSERTEHESPTPRCNPERTKSF